MEADTPRGEKLIIFGEVVHHGRIMKQWPQWKLAEEMRKVGYHWQAGQVSAAEHANRRVDVAEAEALAQILGIPFEDMTSGHSPLMDRDYPIKIIGWNAELDRSEFRHCITRRKNLPIRLRG
jgi:hypothetical protein